MTIFINNIPFDMVTELHCDRTTRRTDIRYNTQGDMLIDLVSRKYVLTVAFGLMSAEQLSALRQLTSEIFVTVRFTAPEGEVTAQFHIVDEPAPTVTTVNGVVMYGGVLLKMLEK